VGTVTNSLRARLPQVQAIPVIIEVVPQFGDFVKNTLSTFGIPIFYDMSIGQFRFLTVDALPVQLVDQVASIQGVEVVHLDFPITFFGPGPFNLIQFFREGGRLRDLVIGENIRVFNILTDRQTTPGAGWIGTKRVRQVVKADQAINDGVDGSQTKVAILDTGVFSRHIATPTNIIQDTVSRFGVMTLGDSSGHGTHVNAITGFIEATGPTGIDTQGMSKAQLISIKTLRTPKGVARGSDVLRGIEIATKVYGAKIINMSLGHKAEELPTVGSTEKVITDLSKNQGRIFVCAIGNSGPSAKTAEAPAHTPEAIAVGAHSIMDGTVAWFSSRGPALDGGTKPDITAPGGGRKAQNLTPNELIYAPTSYLSSLDRTDNLIGIRPRMAFGALQGTSQASPVVAGVLALWNDYFKRKKGREITFTDVFNILKAKGGTKNSNTGYGLINYTWVRGG